MNFVDIVHEIIEQRRSMGILAEPAPSEEQLMLALNMAQFAPDHRRLKPTRFVIVNSHQREHFADILVNSIRYEYGDIESAMIEKIHQQVLRAPMIVLAFTQIQVDEKVPAFEQLLSTGAAIQNVLLSLQAQGFASMWRTGEWVKSTYIKQYFGLTAEDYLSAILYIGTATRQLPPRPNDINPQFIKSIEQFPRD